MVPFRIISTLESLSWESGSSRWSLNRWTRKSRLAMKQCGQRQVSHLWFLIVGEIFPLFYSYLLLHLLGVKTFGVTCLRGPTLRCSLAYVNKECLLFSCYQLQWETGVIFTSISFVIPWLVICSSSSFIYVLLLITGENQWCLCLCFVSGHWSLRCRVHQLHFCGICDSLGFGVDWTTPLWYVILIPALLLLNIQYVINQIKSMDSTIHVVMPPNSKYINRTFSPRYDLAYDINHIVISP